MTNINIIINIIIIRINKINNLFAELLSDKI
jgi:hypothetical protein